VNRRYALAATPILADRSAPDGFHDVHRATISTAARNFWTSGDFNFDGVVNARDFNGHRHHFGAAFTDPPLGALVPERRPVIALR